MTQKQRILLALRHWISPLEALRQAGSMKLSSRVTELKREGYDIESKWHKSGDYKIYRIKPEKH